MIGAALSALGSIASYLGFQEGAKLLNQIGVKDSTIQKVANKVLNAAEKAGSRMLNRALEIVQSIPAIAGSPTVKDYLTKARQNATNNYNRVEQDVSDMKNAANNVANEIQEETGKSQIQKWITGSRIKRNINSKADKAIDLINLAEAKSKNVNLNNVEGGINNNA